MYYYTVFLCVLIVLSTASPSFPTRSSFEICSRFMSDSAFAKNSTAPNFIPSPDVSTCSTGQITPATVDLGLVMLNLVRWLAGLDPVTYDPSIQQASDELTYMFFRMNNAKRDPPSNWTCWTPGAAYAAGHSSLGYISNPPGSAIAVMILLNPSNYLNHSLVRTNFGWYGGFGIVRTWGDDVIDVSRVSPSLVALPGPGFYPIQALSDVYWTAQINESYVFVKASIIRVRTGADITRQSFLYLDRVYVLPLINELHSGEVYSVIVTTSGAPWGYNVTLVDCRCLEGCVLPSVCLSNNGTCCTPSCCEGKQCGSDGCGGSCGSCTMGDCQQSQCVPFPVPSPAPIAPTDLNTAPTATTMPQPMPPTGGQSEPTASSSSQQQQSLIEPPKNSAAASLSNYFFLCDLF